MYREQQRLYYHVKRREKVTTKENFLFFCFDSRRVNNPLVIVGSIRGPEGGQKKRKENGNTSGVGKFSFFSFAVTVLCPSQMINESENRQREAELCMEDKGENGVQFLTPYGHTILDLTG